MKTKTCVVGIFIILLTQTLNGDEISEKAFENDLHLTEEETGGSLHLRSQGKLSDIVDLDRTECVKVRKS